MNWRDYRSQFQFGLTDGLNGLCGLVIGLSTSHSPAKIVLVALMARAGSSSISMAGAEYQSEDGSGTRGERFGCVSAMGLGYLSSAVIPGLGFAFGSRQGLIAFSILTPLFLVLIAQFRAKKIGWPKSIITTLSIFILAVGAGLLASWIGGL